jgi:chromate transporter
MDAIVEKPIATAAAPASMREALVTWAQVSAAGIGGAALQLATMHRLLVQRKCWISEERFFHALSCCIALPGPETQQLAVYIGWLAHRMIGGIIAGGLFVLPGALCMMAACVGYVTGAESPVGQAIFLGIRPAILAIMIEAILRFGHHVIHNKWMAALAAAAFVAAFLQIAFPIIIVAAAALGGALGLAGLPGLARPQSAARKGAATHEFDVPDHTRPKFPHFVRALTFWLALWLAPPVTLFALFGFANIYTQISLLFGKVALMALGGDYAVVAYAAQQAIESYHWLSAREMQAGIAMGEMVPGTIMIVTQFIGFIAAYRHPGFLLPVIAGALGGALATWMTFCPCFLWISLVAPFIEGLRRQAVLNSTLQGVTAAAVGMILNLSAWFAIRTLFHAVERTRYAFFGFDRPIMTSFDCWALALFAGALIAVFYFKIGTVKTLMIFSATGVLPYVLGLTT